ncbi:hypothetical protein Tco_0756830 [Tanacetum coccineum]
MAYPLPLDTAYTSKSLSLDELRSPNFNFFSDQEYSEKEEAEAMAKTMKQYMSKTQSDYESGVARPKIEEKDNSCDAKKAIQEMAEYSQKWHNGTSRGRSTKTYDDWTVYTTTEKNTRKEIKKVNEKVYAAQVECEQCKGPHYTKDFPLKEEGKTLEEAYYTQFGGPFQGGGYRATTLDSIKGTTQILHTKNGGNP